MINYLQLLILTLVFPREQSLVPYFFSSATNLETDVSKLQCVINDTVTGIYQKKLIINVEKFKCITIGSRNKL